jgi:CheY-like chemotaxis protein
MRQSATAAGRPTTVLVADDDDELRGVIVDALRNDGYDVVEACDGNEALEYLVRTADDMFSKPDVLLTDIEMPGLSGLDVLEALRPSRASLPVVVMTGLEDAAVPIAAERLGAVGVLRKPFDLDDLRTVILNAGRTHDARRGPHAS